jgi:hypothetical protein
LVSKSLKPFNTLLLEQYGHPRPDEVRLTIDATHVCPFAHFQGFFAALPGLITLVSQPSACAAISGNLVFKSLNPTWTV